MKISVSHAGKQHSYHLAKSLQDLGALHRFYTSSYLTPAWAQRLVSTYGPEYLRRRFEPGLSGRYVSAAWHLELPEMIVKARQGRGAAFMDAVYTRDEAFDEHSALRIARDGSEAFWGFQGSAMQTLLACRAAGKPAVVELATAHAPAARKYLGEEARLWPDWADSIDNFIFPSDYERRLEEEPFAANRAVAASAFTRQTLLEAGLGEDKILYLPLGFSLGHVEYQERTEQPSRPFRFLYAGNVTQRKGMAYLLDAMASLRNHAPTDRPEIELHIIGTVTGSGQAFAAAKDLYTYHGPMGQQQLFATYQEYDALVLPTLFEGFGLVLVEAMAAGLPIITTPHSFGPELIEEDKTGHLVPIRDVPALAVAMVRMASLDTSTYLAMRYAARQKALEYSWDTYRTRLAGILPQIKV